MYEYTDLEEIWNEEENITKSNDPVVSWESRSILNFLLIWQFCFGVSDAGVVTLLIFLSKYLRLLLSNYEERVLNELCTIFPKSLKATVKLIKIDKDNFTQFIVCPHWDSVFDYEFGFVTENGNIIPNCCPHVAMPYYTSVSQRQPCNGPLIKCVRNRSGNVSDHPYKVFPYQPVKNSLKNLISKKVFQEYCESIGELDKQ